MNLNWLDLFLLILASFRLTRLLVFDTITQFIRRPFLEIVEEVSPDGTTTSYMQIKGKGIRRFFGELLSCYWCLGFWCSLFIVSIYHSGLFFAKPLIIVLAIAGAASFLETLLEKLQEN